MQLPDPASGVQHLRCAPLYLGSLGPEMRCNFRERHHHLVTAGFKTLAMSPHGLGVLRVQFAGPQRDVGPEEPTAYARSKPRQIRFAIVHNHALRQRAACGRQGSACGYALIGCPLSLPISEPLLRRRSDWHDLACPGRYHTEFCPCFGKLAPLLEQVAAPVRGLDLVADDVSERHFSGLAGEISALRSPIAE